MQQPNILYIHSHDTGRYVQPYGHAIPTPNIQQLAEEGATQAFFPLTKNQIVVGAVGVLQFDLVAFRLADEYRAECIWEDANLYTARWIYCDDEKKLEEFKNKNRENLATDGGGHLTYLASSRVNLALTEERWPQITFAKTREH